MFVNANKNFALTHDPRLYETMIVNNVQWNLNDNGNMSGRRGELWVNGREGWQWTVVRVGTICYRICKQQVL